MNIKVDKDNVKILAENQVHEGEYKANECNFTFSEEYTNEMVKKALFIDESGNAYEMVISENKCNIPAEILVKEQVVTIGVYGCIISNNELKLRLSPTPTRKNIELGSYKSNAVPSEEITPSQYEQYLQAMQDAINSAKAEVLAATPSVSVGQTTTGNPGTNASVVNSGTAKDLVLDFTIPKGDKGDKGNTGNSIEYDWDGTKLGVRVEGQSEYSYVDLQGIQGVPGPQGEPFRIKKTYSSVAEMNADFDNMNVGDYVMIASTVEIEDNAKLYTRGEEQWIFITDFSGATGIKGETGATPNIQIGTVQSGSTPSVTRTGTNENPVLNFTLVKGDKGDRGQTGEPGATGNGIASVVKTGTSGLVDTYTITFTNGNTTTFTVSNGKGISSIVKTGTSGLVDTYTITFNDNSTMTYTVTNGEDGEVTQAQLDETNAEVERAKMIYNAMPKASGSGEVISLDGTAECPLYEIGLKGNTSQDGTPTPDSPQDIHVVSGDNNVKVENKNLVSEIEQGTFNYLTGALGTSSNQIRTKKIKIQPSTIYTISSKLALGECCTYYYQNDGTTGVAGSLLASTTTNKSISFTTPSNVAYVIFRLGASSVPYSATDDNEIMIEKGSTSTSYIAHQEQNYPINLPSGMEVCKIPNTNYKDRIFHAVNGDEYYDSLTTEQKNALTYGKWYLHKEVGKVVLDGNTSNLEVINSKTNSTYFQYRNPIFENINTTVLPDALCNYFIGGKAAEIYYNDDLKFTFSAIGNLRFNLTNDIASTIDGLKTWLSTHNLIVCGALNTPTNTEITYQPLITQLNNLEKALSYAGQTNISQVNNDLAFKIDASAIRDLSGIFEAIGE